MHDIYYLSCLYKKFNQKIYLTNLRFCQFYILIFTIELETKYLNIEKKNYF